MDSASWLVSEESRMASSTYAIFPCGWLLLPFIIDQDGPVIRHSRDQLLPSDGVIDSIFYKLTNPQGELPAQLDPAR